MNKWHVTSLIILLTAFCLIVWFAVLWLYPWKGIEIYNQPYEVLTPEVVQGEYVKYHIEYCRFTNVDSLVLHQLIDDEGTTFRIIDSVQIASVNTEGIRLTEGCGELNKAVLIPHFIEPGTYQLEESVSYKINPFHTTSYKFITEPFEVIAE